MAGVDRETYGQMSEDNPEQAPRRAGGARTVALAVLHRVAEQGAYASAALDAELARKRLDPRDVGLATEIVYGALRVLPELDRAIAAHVKHDPARMDGLTRAALRSAAYQLSHLSRVPPHAVVDETVSLVREQRGPKVAGFVNAVLRKLARERPAEPRLPDRLAVPEWLSRTLHDSLGVERAQAMLGDRPLPPPMCLRIEPERTTRQALLSELSQAQPAAELEASPLSPLAILARRVGSPRALPGYAEGLWTVQEEGAQLVALALGAAAGERIADVCAGHGGKTTLFSRLVGASGHVTAIDVDERKLARIAPELSRLGLPQDRVDTQPIDVSVGVGGLLASFDRVLVDAPCTGLGTVDRRPELLLRLGAEDAARLAALQLRILSKALGLLRPGGILGYAVCSPTRAEGEGVASRLQAQEPRLERVMQPLVPELPAPDPDGVLRIGPWLSRPGSFSRPDAYQLVLWRLRG